MTVTYTTVKLLTRVDHVLYNAPKIRHFSIHLLSPHCQSKSLLYHSYFFVSLYFMLYFIFFVLCILLKTIKLLTIYDNLFGWNSNLIGVYQVSLQRKSIFNTF